MKNPDELRRENEVLRDRLSRLSAAVLRVSASLDLNTVLQEVVESARALTGARSGAITAVDARGQARDFVSSGLTPEEHRQLAEWPDGPRFFDHPRDLPAPLRLPDARAYVRSLGFSSDLILTTSVQGTPMRHRGAHVGNFFLGDKEGGEEFSSEDEEVLMLFAAQAATAIANARTYRDEQRARADLEALIRHLAGRRRGLRGEQRCGGVDQSGGATDCRRPPHAGALPGGATGGGHLPTRGWTRGIPRRVPPGAAVEQRRDRAGRGDRDLGPRRPARQDAGQRHADPFRGRRGRVRREKDESSKHPSSWSTTTRRCCTT